MVREAGSAGEEDGSKASLVFLGRRERRTASELSIAVKKAPRAGTGWSRGVERSADFAVRLVGGVCSNGWCVGSGRSRTGGLPGGVVIVGSASLLLLDTFGRHVNTT